MRVIVFNRSLSDADFWSQVCVRHQLSLSVHHSISNEVLAGSSRSRILIFDQTVLGKDRSIANAMYRNLLRDVIAVTCVNASVSYAVDHMRMGAKWVFSSDADASILDTGMISLIKCAEEMGALYQEHLTLQAKFVTISPAEWKVLNCVLLGMTNKEIAVELDVSIRTIESRRSNANRKLGVRNLASMVRCVDRATFLKNQFEPDISSRVNRMTNHLFFDFRYGQLQQATATLG